MYVGVLIAGFSMLRDRRNGTELAVGVLAMIYAVGVPASVVMTIYYRVKAKMIKYNHFEEKNNLQRLLLPWGFWAPEQMSQAYSRHIGGFLPNFRKYLSAYPMIVVGLACILSHLLPSSISCFYRFLFVALVFFVSAIALIVIRPHRIPATTGFASATFLVLGVLSIILALAFRSPSIGLELAKLVLTFSNY